MKKCVRMFGGLFASALVLTVAVSGPATAWDGFDYSSGSYVTVEEGNLVRSGLDIEVFDYGSGDYKQVQVQSITDSGLGVELEVYDYDTGEYRTLSMDD